MTTQTSMTFKLTLFGESHFLTLRRYSSFFLKPNTIKKKNVEKHALPTRRTIQKGVNCDKEILSSEASAKTNDTKVILTRVATKTLFIRNCM